MPQSHSDNQRIPSELDFSLDAYDFALPEHLIAQQPAMERDGSRLLVLDRAAAALQHVGFRDLPGLLLPGDLLVVNDTRVVPARLFGKRDSGGQVELLLVRALGLQRATAQGFSQRWYAIGRPAARIRPERVLEFAEGLVAWPEHREGEGWVLRLEASEPILEVLERAGRLPLPPYIHRASHLAENTLADRERYQTVFARVPGSAAAPTAGLHFTPALFQALQERGVELARLTLHVGTGTFSPVRTGDIRAHRLHSEPWAIHGEALEKLRRALVEGRRIVAVGTTVVRTLEAAAEHLLAYAKEGVLPHASQIPRELPSPDTDQSDTVLSGDTDIFIYPGYGFRIVKAVVTNFHLPRSSLLMLVSAFAGRECIMNAYAEAVRQEYRFFSYGDAMLIQ